MMVRAAGRGIKRLGSGFGAGTVSLVVRDAKPEQQQLPFHYALFISC